MWTRDAAIHSLRLNTWVKNKSKCKPNEKNLSSVDEDCKMLQEDWKLQKKLFSKPSAKSNYFWISWEQTEHPFLVDPVNESPEESRSFFTLIPL